MEYTLSIGDFDSFTLLLGYMNQKKDSNFMFMIEILVYWVIILLIKVYLRKKKYEYQEKHITMERRALQLTNLSKKATTNDIQNLFSNYEIEDITFTYRVQKYFRCMKKIMQLQKEIRYFITHPGSSII